MRRCAAPNRHADEGARRGAVREALPVADRAADHAGPAGQRDERVGGEVIGERPNRVRSGEGDRGVVRAA